MEPFTIPRRHEQAAFVQKWAVLNIATDKEKIVTISRYTDPVRCFAERVQVN
jgi:hypothetical protein